MLLGEIRIFCDGEYLCATFGRAGESPLHCRMVYPAANPYEYSDQRHELRRYIAMSMRREAQLDGWRRASDTEVRDLLRQHARDWYAPHVDADSRAWIVLADPPVYSDDCLAEARIASLWLCPGCIAAMREAGATRPGRVGRPRHPT